MQNAYENKTNAQLTRTLRSRSLPVSGTKAELIQRLLDADEAHAARKNEIHEYPPPYDGRPTVPDITDVFSVYDALYLLFNFRVPGMTATMKRLVKSLRKGGVYPVAVDAGIDKAFTVLWERIARGRKLPALVKRGRVIGDLQSTNEWLGSGVPREHVDQACENAQVNFPEPELGDPDEPEGPPTTLISEFGLDPFGRVIPPWAQIPQPTPDSISWYGQL